MDEYRKQMNTIDHQLITLLEKRVELSRKIGKYKCMHNIPPFEPEPTTNIQSSLSDSYIRIFFKGIYEISCNAQQLDRLDGDTLVL
jgi:chorismate mutase